LAIYVTQLLPVISKILPLLLEVINRFFTCADVFITLFRCVWASLSLRLLRIGVVCVACLINTCRLPD